MQLLPPNRNSSIIIAKFLCWHLIFTHLRSIFHLSSVARGPDFIKLWPWLQKLANILLFVYMGPMETELSNLFLQTTILLSTFECTTLWLFFQEFQVDLDQWSKSTDKISIIKCSSWKLRSVRKLVTQNSE